MKLKFWEVRAQAFHPVSGNALEAPRDEVVGQDNPLFRECNTILDVKKAYESFWNELGSGNELVFVQRITILKK